MGAGPDKSSLPMAVDFPQPVAAAHAAVGGSGPLHFPTLQHLTSYLAQVPSSETVLLPVSGSMGVVYPLGASMSSSSSSLSSSYVAMPSLVGSQSPLGVAKPVGFQPPR